MRSFLSSRRRQSVSMSSGMYITGFPDPLYSFLDLIQALMKAFAFSVSVVEFVTFTAALTV